MRVTVSRKAHFNAGTLDCIEKTGVLRKITLFLENATIQTFMGTTTN